jgi:hypothetical protein
MTLRSLPLLSVLVACGSPKDPAACADGQEFVDGACVDAACAPVTGFTREVAPGEETLSAALETAVSGDVLALVEGTYVEPQGVEVPAGVAVVGPCSAKAIIEAGFSDPGVLADEATGVRLQGFTVLGGAPGIDLGTSDAGEVEIRDVRVEGAGTYGLFVSGAVVVDAVGLAVSDTLAGNGGGFGRAVSAQAGARVTLAEATFTGNREAALFADGATLDLADVTVDGTDPAGSGAFGRGVHVQRGAALSAARISVANSHDSGITVLGSTLELLGGEISGTALAPFEDDSGSGGEGVAVLGGSTATLRDLQVAGNARAGVFVDAATVTLDTLSVRENAYSIVTQQGASVSGLGSCELGAGQIEALDLSGTDALPIWDEPMF